MRDYIKFPILRNASIEGKFDRKNGVVQVTFPDVLPALQMTLPHLKKIVSELEEFESSYQADMYKGIRSGAYILPKEQSA